MSVSWQLQRKTMSLLLVLIHSLVHKRAVYYINTVKASISHVSSDNVFMNWHCKDKDWMIDWISRTKIAISDHLDSAWWFDFCGDSFIMKQGENLISLNSSLPASGAMVFTKDKVTESEADLREYKFAPWGKSVLLYLSANWWQRPQAEKPKAAGITFLYWTSSIYTRTLAHNLIFWSNCKLTELWNLLLSWMNTEQLLQLQLGIEPWVVIIHLHFYQRKEDVTHRTCRDEVTFHSGEAGSDFGGLHTLTGTVC